MIAKFSSEFYDDIWNPYNEYVIRYLETHPPGLRSFLKLSSDLSRYMHLLGNDAIRQVPDWKRVNWKKTLSNYEQKRIYGRKNLDESQFWISDTGWGDLWVAYCLSFVLAHDRAAPRAYIDMGCGFGGFLFDIHARTLNDECRFFGIDHSPFGVECGNRVFSLLDNEPSKPFHQITTADIVDIPSCSFDCGGLDVVIYTVSALNKIHELPADYYGMVKRSLMNHGTIEIVHIESTGWQLYFDTDLAETFLGMAPKVRHFNPDDMDRFRGQRSNDLDVGANINLMRLIADGQTEGLLNVRNVFLNTFSPNPLVAYSAIHLDLI